VGAGSGRRKGGLGASALGRQTQAAGQKCRVSGDNLIAVIALAPPPKWPEWKAGELHWKAPALSSGRSVQATQFAGGNSGLPLAPIGARSPPFGAPFPLCQLSSGANPAGKQAANSAQRQLAPISDDQSLIAKRQAAMIAKDNH